jgi:hypothetical protein
VSNCDILGSVTPLLFPWAPLAFRRLGSGLQSSPFKKAIQNRNSQGNQNSRVKRHLSYSPFPSLPKNKNKNPPLKYTPLNYSNKLKYINNCNKRKKTKLTRLERFADLMEETKAGHMLLQQIYWTLERLKQKDENIHNRHTKTKRKVIRLW